MERLAPVGPFPLDLNHLAKTLGVKMTINPPTPEQVAYAESQPLINPLYDNTGDEHTPWNEDAIHDVTKNETVQTPILNSSGQVNKRDEATMPVDDGVKSEDFEKDNFTTTRDYGVVATGPDGESEDEVKSEDETEYQKLVEETETTPEGEPDETADDPEQPSFDFTKKDEDE